MTWRRAAMGITALTTAACNMISGADEIELVPDHKSATTSSSGSGGAPATTASAATTGTSTSTGSPSSGGSSGSGNMGTLVPADGVTITEIKLYQGVERPLMKDGATVSSDIPIVAGRDAYLRVFYSSTETFKGTLRVSFGSGTPLEQAVTVAGSSTQKSLGSTANIAIPGERIGSGTGIRVDVLNSSNQSSGSNLNAVYPKSGLATLPVQSVGSTVKIVIVPISYGADGSNRLPDTSQQQLDRYRDAIYRMYPVPSVTITVKPAVTWKQAVDPGGNGWDTLLNAIADYRAKAGAADDEYYYGVFNAASSFINFCSQGCVSGLSLLAGPNDAMARAGIGIGFTGEDAASTAAHEIGHQHGRPHAPCGVNQGVDQAFPHPDGSLGTWGFDLLTQTLISPDKADFMSYCHPEWVSDFNFKSLFTRIKLVNNALWVGGPPVLYDRVAIGPDGHATWLEPIQNSANASGEATEVVVTTDAGPSKLVGHFYPYSHLQGGVLLIPRSEHTAHRVSFAWGGTRLDLDRVAP